MKKSVVTLALMAACCLGLQSAYALPSVTKRCPDCGGKGHVESWYGGYERCEKCGGDGKVCNWFGVVAMVAGCFACYKFWCGKR